MCAAFKIYDRGGENTSRGAAKARRLRLFLLEQE